MKKIFVMIICAIALVSCASVREAGVGRAYSDNEQIAGDRADLYAAVDASKQNNWVVESTDRIVDADKNGNTTSIYTSTKVGKTSSVFTHNNFNRSTKKKGKGYRVITKFNGRTIEQ